MKEKAKNNSLIRISPSILAADFGHLAKEVERVEQAGADAIHIDIMDGHFVPNLTMGPHIVSAINRATNLFLDVHLMMYNPFDYVEAFVKAGADQITIHFEATEDVEDILAYIRRCNIKAGLAFCPETSASMIPKFLDQCDTLLLMTVNPGFGGQSFMPEVLEKVEFARDVCNRLRIGEGGKTFQGTDPFPAFNIQVDGGINEETIKACAKAGATDFVAGTFLFKSDDLAQAVSLLRKNGEEGAKMQNLNQ